MKSTQKLPLKELCERAGIPVGAIFTWHNDPRITAKYVVVGEKGKVEYQGEILSTGKLTDKLMGGKPRRHSRYYWMYNGKSLRHIRDRLIEQDGR